MSLRLVNKADGRHVGIAFADASERVLGVSEFLEDEMFSNTEVSGLEAGQYSRTRLALMFKW